MKKKDMATIADITNLSLPSSQYPGEYVIVDVSVKNIGTGYRDIAVTGNMNLTWQFDYLNIGPGETVVFRGWFTMPAIKADLTVWSWYWDGSQWQLGDTATGSILPASSDPTVSEFKISDYVKM